MLQLQQSDLKACLDTVHAIGEAAAGGEGFARAGMACLKRLVPSELTHLSICDLDSGHRNVVSDVPGAIAQRHIEVFDRHFKQNPLVREHGRNPNARTRRISDLMHASDFLASPLYGEYYRAVGIDHTIAVPIHVDQRLLVSFVFNRIGSDFADRESARLEAIRRHLGDFYRISRAMEAASAQWAPAPSPGAPLDPHLTSREGEVLKWLAAGKTDRDIADILEISPRTVHKHLQRIYEKLGVETRTAAVVRAMRMPGRDWAPGRVHVRTPGTTAN